MSGGGPPRTRYAWLADSILAVDKLNPIVASRMADPFTQWRCYDGARQALMRAQLERMLAAGLSANAAEVVSKSLKDVA